MQCLFRIILPLSGSLKQWRAICQSAFLWMRSEELSITSAHCEITSTPTPVWDVAPALLFSLQTLIVEMCLICQVGEIITVTNLSILLPVFYLNKTPPPLCMYTVYTLHLMIYCYVILVDLFKRPNKMKTNTEDTEVNVRDRWETFEKRMVASGLCDGKEKQKWNENEKKKSATVYLLLHCPFKVT